MVEPGPLKGPGSFGCLVREGGAEQTAVSRENAREVSLNRIKKEDRSAKDWLDDYKSGKKKKEKETI